LNDQGEAVVEVITTQHASLQLSSKDLSFKVNLGDDFVVTSNEDQALRNLFHDYADVFSRNSNDLGFTNKVQHRIVTTDDITIKQPDRRIPPQLILDDKKVFNDWLSTGVIKVSIVRLHPK
jgi:hypothetical protein